MHATMYGIKSSFDAATIAGAVQQSNRSSLLYLPFIIDGLVKKVQCNKKNFFQTFKDANFMEILEKSILRVVFSKIICLN